MEQNLDTKNTQMPSEGKWPLNYIASKIIERARKTPYFHLDDYMMRHSFIPSPKGKDARPIATVHEILRSDTDRAYHDHPWWYITWVLKGGYFEHRPVWDAQGDRIVGDQKTWCPPGTILFRKPSALHWLELPKGQTATTLFISGPKSQEWGFVAANMDWMHNKDFFNMIGRET